MLAAAACVGPTQGPGAAAGVGLLGPSPEAGGDGHASAAPGPLAATRAPWVARRATPTRSYASPRTVPRAVGADGAPPPEAPRVIWGGDVLPGRDGRAPTGDGPLAALTPWLAAADLAVVNLEGPLGPAPRVASGPFDVAGEGSTAAWLAAAGVDVAGLANNHAADHGPRGIDATRAALTAAGLMHVGAGEDAAVARVVSLSRLRVAILACDATGLGGAGPVASCAEMRASIDAARARAEVVAVLIHWGTEYASRPDAGQRRLAAALVAAGADLVVGAHPHVVQSVAWLARPDGPPALVAFSLGNLAWDSAVPSARRGALLETALGPGGVLAYRMRAVVAAGGRGRPASERAAQWRWPSSDGAAP